VRGAEDPGLYSHNRWGHFTYAVPVADGTYRLILRFAETYWRSSASGGNNGRLFDVYCNGKALVNRLDIYKDAGGENQALELSYRGLKPNAQNKLVLSFVPVVDYAILFAIKVEDQNLRQPLKQRISSAGP
jgi:beta-galactosidase